MVYRLGFRSLLAFNTSKQISPITLNNEWPTLWRLIFIVLFAIIGTLINGFFVASFFVTNPLKKTGFVYLACVGLADLIISTGVIPTVGFVMISKVWEVSSVCYGLQFVTQAATYSYNLLFMMVAIETYTRLCRTRAAYRRFLAVPVGFVSFMMFAVSFAASGVGTYLGMDYDYCTRENFGNITFRLMTAMIFFVLPFFCTTMFLSAASVMLRARARRLAHYRKSQQYDRDYSFTNLNLACYMIFVVAWTPYLTIVNKYPNTSDEKFYNCAWIGLCRSIITSFVYGGLDSNFRHAFAHLFFYCCCKTSLTAPYNNRHRRGCNYQPGDVRVHILHNCMAVNPQRVAAANNGGARDGNEI